MIIWGESPETKVTVGKIISMSKFYKLLILQPSRVLSGLGHKPLRIKLDP